MIKMKLKNKWWSASTLPCLLLFRRYFWPPGEDIILAQTLRSSVSCTFATVGLGEVYSINQKNRSRNRFLTFSRYIIFRFSFRARARLFGRTQKYNRWPDSCRLKKKTSRFLLPCWMKPSESKVFYPLNSSHLAAILFTFSCPFLIFVRLLCKNKSAVILCTRVLIVLT